ncbi:DUF5309 domain-containing protein [Bradyrhizobium sp. LVM 105]|uniref:DUF5309 domain-containing protein n=1 Tax=Bradyrhizobium sp. LVM 105 TaxID=2341115 RepID=UPI000F802CBA|nr:DUF5309 domain-containing protein [Bradyrhizobium sp. LVM 105]RTE91903.1 head protein [Bradyrhizobium sp. LVM 105]
MALPTNTFSAYDAIGNREDLIDKIYKTSPTDTPLISAIERVKATAVYHEWQTQALAAADTANAVLEGDDAVTDAATPTVRLGNYCQISDKVPRVSGTQEAVEHAGRGSEMDYQIALKTQELKIDLEAILFGTNQARNAGAAATARKVASVLSWIKTNTSKSGSDPAAADGTGTRTDGTQRAFTESQLKTVLQSIWTNGGKPGTIALGGFNKQSFSTFTGRATPMEEASSKKIVASVDFYDSDFGKQKVMACRNMRARDCLVLQMDMWAMATVRNMKMKDLAVTGDSKRVQILTEYSLEARNEKSSGGIFDLTTS